jgi:hypothetical protein
MRHPISRQNIPEGGRRGVLLYRSLRQFIFLLPNCLSGALSPLILLPLTLTMSYRVYGTPNVKDEDDRKLESLGYVPSFKREFSSLATVRICSHFVSICLIPFLMAPTDKLCVQYHGAYTFFLVNVILTSSQGLCSSVATTFNTPLLLGGPSSVRQQAHTYPSVIPSVPSP